MAKKDIHPEWYPEAVVKVNGEPVMTVGATIPEMNVEIWSGTHPFFTGQQRLVDTEGQVERFMRRLQKREEHRAEIEEEEEEPLQPQDIPVDDITNLSTRATKALKEEGLETVGAVLARFEEGGEDALLALVGVGQKAVIDIKKYLRSLDLIE
jgi:large subunit ribosomal protein L31